jgi:hypothetical protein
MDHRVHNRSLPADRLVAKFEAGGIATTRRARLERNEDARRGVD